MKTKEEAIDYLIACAAELFELGPDSHADQTLLDQAVELIRQPDRQIEAEEAVDAIKEMCGMMEKGAAYHLALYERLSVKLQLEQDPTMKYRFAVAVSEAAGGASAIGSLLAFILSDAGPELAPEQVFTGQGLTYPKVLKETGNKLFLPPR